jgi:choice-of-anchor B domain-containing protein
MSLAELGGGTNTNDIWGWKSQTTGREYALVGCFNGTAFVDITNPTAPVLIGNLPTHTTPSLWRDLESRGNFLFIVSEAPSHGLQVFDLTALDTVTSPPQAFTETAHYAGFGNAHTLNINQETGYLYAMGTGTFAGGLHIVNINNPYEPVLAGGFDNDGYTHDGFVTVYHGPDQDYQGAEIVVACNADALTIVNCTDKTDCQQVSTASYPGVGYVHQGWFTKDMRYFLEDDETDEMNQGVGTRTHMWDLADLDNPVYMGFKQWNNTAIDHNLYIQDQFVYASNYRSGVRAYDAIGTAEAALTEIGYFDLYAADDGTAFSGTWSNYPYLPSGVNIATSMYDGFFITKQTMVQFSQNEWSICGENEVSFNASINTNLSFPLTAQVSGLPGNVSINNVTWAAQGTNTIVLSNLTSLPVGSFSGTIKFVTTNGRAYEFPLFFEVLGSPSVQLNNLTPANGENVAVSSSSIDFIWEDNLDALYYNFEIATDAAFTNIVSSEIVNASPYQFTNTLSEGQYFWRIRMVGSCGTGPWSNPTDFNVVFVNVHEVDGSAQLTVRPNPANDIVTVSNIKFGSYVVTDMLGRTVVAGTCNKQIELNCSAWPAGLYVIRSGNERRQLVVE